MKKVAILLLNLGGPETQADVKGFLYNLFADRRIITLPFGLRHGLAAFIAHTRTPLAQANYRYMGGGSPILAETRAQADALQARLDARHDMEARVFVGMRYWHPFIGAVAAEIAAYAPDEIVLLPLYPQFSSTTTLTAFETFERAYRGPAAIKRVCCYANNDDFIAAHVSLIRASLAKLADPQAYRLLFSAHGLPQKIVDAGDPYQSQIEATVARILTRLGPHDHVICYQSRVGRLKWLGPATDEEIRRAGGESKPIVVIPVAFVSEHVETLVELDIEYGHLAREVGVPDYVRVPALGVNPDYIQALAGEVAKALSSEADVIGDETCADCHAFCPKRSLKRSAR